MVFVKGWGQKREEKSFPVGGKKAENNWLLPLAVNKSLELSRPLVRHLWIKGAFFKKSKKLYLSLPKKYILRAVDRNRLRRWTKEEWRKAGFKKGGYVGFLQKEKGFYQYLKRRDFNHAFEGLAKKMGQKS